MFPQVILIWVKYKNRMSRLYCIAASINKPAILLHPDCSIEIYNRTCHHTVIVLISAEELKCSKKNQCLHLGGMIASDQMVEEKSKGHVDGAIPMNNSKGKGEEIRI